MINCKNFTKGFLITFLKGKHFEKLMNFMIKSQFAVAYLYNIGDVMFLH